MDLSIIVPVYNVESYLKECLESIVSQNLTSYEVIMINDGSTDKSRNICELYCNRYKNFHLINQSNHGLPYSRNAGFRIAHGDYIWNLDSDDYINGKSYLQEAVNYIKEKKLEVLMFDAKAFIEENCNYKFNVHVYERGRYISEKKEFTGKEFLDIYYPMGKYNSSSCLYLLSREFILKNELYQLSSLRFNEDDEFTFRLLMKAKKVQYINLQILSRRVHDDSITTSKVNKRKCKCMLLILWRIKQIVKKEKKDLSDHQKMIISSLLMNYFTFSIELFSMLNGREGQKYINFICKKFFYELDKLTMIRNVDVIKCIIDSIQIINKHKLNALELERNIKKVYNLDTSNDVIDDLIQEKNKQIKLIVSNIGFNDATKIIGIYGIGSYSKNMIEFYKKNIGEIKCKIIFIDSYKKSNDETFMNREIINVKDINKYSMDTVVICSTFEREILNNLIKFNFKENIFSFNKYNCKNLFV